MVFINYYKLKEASLPFFFENKYIENTRFEDIVFRFYEDTEKYKNEEIPPEVANPEIVKALKERRLVVFQMRCKYDGDMYRYITASDYAVEYLTKQTINKEEGDYYLLELPTNKALAFQDMLFIGDFIDNSISTNDELFQILYMINVQFLEIRQQELEEEGLKVVY